MSQSTLAANSADDSLPTNKKYIPFEVRKLLSRHSRNGRMEKDAVGATAWHLDYSTPVITPDNGYESSDDECSIASDGSQITLESQSLHNDTVDLAIEVNTPSSPTVRNPPPPP
jgi:hypothetical protein